MTMFEVRAEADSFRSHFVYLKYAPIKHRKDTNLLDKGNKRTIMGMSEY